MVLMLIGEDKKLVEKLDIKVSHVAMVQLDGLPLFTLNETILTNISIKFLVICNLVAANLIKRCL